MNLDLQVQSLIDGAPDDRSRQEVMAIAPILQQVAATLPQTTYYICQNASGDWLVTTLAHRTQPNRQVKVIYGFNQEEDVRKFEGGALANSLAIEVPIVQLLFYLLAIEELDLIIFLTDSSNLDRGREISTDDLEAAIRESLEPQNPGLPPDVC